MAKREQERPVVTQPDSWAKITVVLLDRHVAYLDRIAVDIRLQYGFAVSRAELIRALIEAAAQSGVVLSDAGNNKEMVAMLSESWAGKTRKKR
jgi:tryptophan synthase alpha subunit